MEWKQRDTGSWVRIEKQFIHFKNWIVLNVRPHIPFFVFVFIIKEKFLARSGNQTAFFYELQFLS